MEIGLYSFGRAPHGDPGPVGPTARVAVAPLVWAEKKRD